jgi:hypothetical protein
MKSLTRLLALSAFILILGVVSAPNALAQRPESSTLRVTEPLDVGGTVLEPGVYLIRLLESASNRNLIQVTNEDRTKVFTTVLSVPHHLGPTVDKGNTSFVYYPAIGGSPTALRTWFAADSVTGGHDIVYPQQRAMELAPVVKAPVVAYVEVAKPEQLPEAKLVVVTPAKVVTPYVEPEPKPAIVAEAREMPRTASRLPLVATLGALLLCAAVGLRAIRTA